MIKPNPPVAKHNSVGDLDNLDGLTNVYVELYDYITVLTVTTDRKIKTKLTIDLSDEDAVNLATDLLEAVKERNNHKART
jgi:hypothetical protein